MMEISQVITNVGFPIAVAVFLLVRLEKKMDDLNATIIDVLEVFLKK